MSRASDLALVGAKIYPSSNQPPIENGSIVVRDGRIVAVGPSSKIKVPRDAQVIDCKGLVVTAGFWNSHVHIMTPGLLHAEKLSSDQIASQLEEMLTRWGFTKVFDIASVLDNTNLIRGRIILGPLTSPLSIDSALDGYLDSFLVGRMSEYGFASPVSFGDDSFSQVQGRD